MHWDSTLYDNRHDFVARYGEGLLRYLPDEPRQRILDLGCGTGTLSAELADHAAAVLGVDSSPDMVARATALHHAPNLRFEVCDALDLPYAGEWDVVFSNAVFHWIGDHDRLLANVRRALKPGGLLICEFGAHGNIAAVDGAFADAMRAHGRDYRCKFTFPTVEAFADGLERHGLRVGTIRDYDRPTPLSDGYDALEAWMTQFYASELEPLDDDERRDVLDRTCRAAGATLWDGTRWTLDYRRLQAVAVAV